MALFRKIFFSSSNNSSGGRTNSLRTDDEEYSITASHGGSGEPATEDLFQQDKDRCARQLMYLGEEIRLDLQTKASGAEEAASGEGLAKSQSASSVSSASSALAPGSPLETRLLDRHDREMRREFRKRMVHLRKELYPEIRQFVKTGRLPQALAPGQEAAPAVTSYRVLTRTGRTFLYTVEVLDEPRKDGGENSTTDPPPPLLSGHDSRAPDAAEYWDAEEYLEAVSPERDQKSRELRAFRQLVLRHYYATDRDLEHDGDEDDSYTDYSSRNGRARRGGRP